MAGKHHGAGHFRHGRPQLYECRRPAAGRADCPRQGAALCLAADGLQNKHYDGADAKVKGQHYLYPHDYPNHWTAQQYLPDAIKDRQYYVPGDNKNEQAFAQYWKKIKGEL